MRYSIVLLCLAFLFVPCDSVGLSTHGSLGLLLRVVVAVVVAARDVVLDDNDVIRLLPRTHLATLGLGPVDRVGDHGRRLDLLEVGATSETVDTAVEPLVPGVGAQVGE